MSCSIIPRVEGACKMDKCTNVEVLNRLAAECPDIDFLEVEGKIVYIKNVFVVLNTVG